MIKGLNGPFIGQHVTNPLERHPRLRFLDVAPAQNWVVLAASFDSRRLANAVDRSLARKSDILQEGCVRDVKTIVKVIDRSDWHPLVGPQTIHINLDRVRIPRARVSDNQLVISNDNSKINHLFLRIPADRHRRAEISSLS